MFFPRQAGSRAFAEASPRADRRRGLGEPRLPHRGDDPGRLDAARDRGRPGRDVGRIGRDRSAGHTGGRDVSAAGRGSPDAAARRALGEDFGEPVRPVWCLGGARRFREQESQGIGGDNIDYQFQFLILTLD